MATVPSREEVRAAAQRVLAWVNGKASHPRLGPAPIDEAIRMVAEAALRRSPPVPADPRADYHTPREAFVDFDGERTPVHWDEALARETIPCAEPIVAQVNRACRANCGDDEFPTAGV